jgi:hypothetical protein
VSIKGRIKRLETMTPATGDGLVILRWPEDDKAEPSPEVLERIKRARAEHPGRVMLFWPDGSEVALP